MTRALKCVVAAEQCRVRDGVTLADYPIRAPARIPMKIGIAIKSCHKYADRRAAQAATWIPRIPESWDYFYLIGFESGSTFTDVPHDALACHVSDAFADIAPKIQCACQYALGENITNLLIADDDTYLVPERLVPSQFTNHEYLGWLRVEGLDYNGGVPYAQGSCYWLGQKSMEYIANDKQHMRPGVIDDGAVGRVLVDRVPFTHDRRYYPGPNSLDKIPTRGNNIISTHKCLPATMHKVHEYYTRSFAQGDLKKV